MGLDSRVVEVDVDVKHGGLLKGEDMNGHAVEDACSLREELVEAPALILVGFQNVSKYWDQLGLEAPGEPRKEGGRGSLELESKRLSLSGGWGALTLRAGNRMAAGSSTRWDHPSPSVPLQWPPSVSLW